MNNNEQTIDKLNINIFYLQQITNTNGIRDGR